MASEEPTPDPDATPIPWRQWHLVAIFALGSVVEWLGAELRAWAGDKLTERWFE